MNCGRGNETQHHVHVMLTPRSVTLSLQFVGQFKKKLLCVHEHNYDTIIIIIIIIIIRKKNILCNNETPVARKDHVQL